MIKALGRVLAALAMCALLYSINFSKLLPDEVMMYAGREHSISIAPGVRLSELPPMMEVSAGTVVAGDVGEYEASISAFGGMARRKVNLKVVEPKTLELGGCLVGIKLRGAGVIVIGFADFYRGDSLREGDIITSVGGADINSYQDFEEHAASGESVSLRVRRGESEFETELQPVLCDDGIMRLGLWVRDSAAGVGTLTFIDRENGVYGALGHGINENDTGVRFPVRKGTIERSRVAGITKGRSGAPGEITGAFVAGAETLGTIELNSDCGIFGRLLSDISDLSPADGGIGSNDPGLGTELPVALSGDVQTGPAEIFCDVGEGVQSYGITIMRLNRLGSATKGILLEITDERLLALTGGIIQGQSGSPIVQNGAIVGAVTHVLVNNPACGYGVFIENMLDYADEAA